MAYTYDAGTTSPTYAGLVEFGGIRVNDGCFKSEHLAGLQDGAPIRQSVALLPNDWGPSFRRISDANMVKPPGAQFAPKWDFMDSAVKKAFLPLDLACGCRARGLVGRRRSIWRSQACC